MDLEKLKRFMRITEEDKDISEQQRKYDMEQAKRSRELESMQSAIRSMLKSQGWKFVGEWKEEENKNLRLRLFKEVRDRDFQKAEKTAAEIEAINKLFSSIFNMAGPQRG
jgi:hypothetical protein